MFKSFVRYYKPHSKLFTLDFSSAFILAILNLSLPFAIKIIVDDFLPNKKLKLFLISIVVLLLINIAGYFLTYIVTYWGHVLGLRMEYDMRKDLFSHIQKLSFSYFDNNKTGAIMSRIVNDLNEVSELAHHGPEDFFIASIMLIGALVAMFMMSIKLTLLVILFLPCLFYFGLKQNRKMRKKFRETRVKIAEINSQVEDSISGIRVVKAFANESFENHKFEQGNRGFKDIKEQTYDIVGRFFSGMYFFNNLILILILGMGGYLYLKNEITLGILLSFLFYVIKFIEPIRKIMNLTEMYQRGLAGFSRFYEVMEMSPDIEDIKNAIELKEIRGNVKFENISFSYDKGKEILKDFDLDIKSGENIALVGPSGAGKTTICSLIPRFYEINKGNIFIDGINLRDISQNSLRENIGIVQQEVFLFNGSLKENIAYGNLDATDEEIVEAARQANALGFIDKLSEKFDTFVGERGVKLSGGQKQRIAIARIFLKNPKILILDEATSALDNRTERLIQNALEKLSKNRTTITIAHRLTTIKNADRIVVIDNSGILELGNHKELIEKNGLYSSLYNSQDHGFLPDKIV